MARLSIPRRASDACRSGVGGYAEQNRLRIARHTPTMPRVRTARCTKIERIPGGSSRARLSQLELRREQQGYHSRFLARNLFCHTVLLTGPYRRLKLDMNRPK